MAPGSRKRIRVDATQVQHGDTAQSPSSEPTTPNTTTSSVVSTTVKRGRGKTRGKGLEKINKASKTLMPIEIVKGKGRPIDAKQSSKLTSELGIIARNLILVPTKWKALKDEDKQVAFERLGTKFEIRLDDPYVRETVESLLQHRSKDARYRYHQRFLKHPTIEEAKRDPPEDLTQENWEALCEYYADPQYQKRCEINKNNRAQLKIKHNQGSKPFVVARYEQRDPVTNEEPGRITFYEHTHKTDEKWTCPEAESQFKEVDNLKKNSNMTDGEAANRVLGTRSDYIKGLGYGPKPSTSASSNRRNVELEEALRETRKENEFLKEQAKTQNETVQNILAKQVEYDKFFKSIILGLLPNTSSTPLTT